MNNITSGILSGLQEFEQTSKFIIKDIEISKINPNPKNFYRIDGTNIEKLAEDINDNELYHNLVVRKVTENTYEIISGERRFRALKLLKWDKIPCLVLNEKENDIDAEIKLIQANANTRERNEQEKALEVKRLNELYNLKKIMGERIKGNTKDIIAKELNISSAQVSRYQRVNKSLIPELKNLFDNAKISLSNASEFASLSEDNQLIVYETLQKNINMTKEEALELKKIILQKETELKQEQEKREAAEESLNSLQGALINKNAEIANIKKESKKRNEDHEKEDLKKKLKTAQKRAKEIELTVEVKTTINALKTYSDKLLEVINDAKLENIHLDEDYKKDLEQIIFKINNN